MSDRLFVTSHKGLFRLERKRKLGAVNWEISRASFLGDSVSMVLPDPRDGTVYAALSLSHFGVKLHRSFNGGENWEECAVPVYPHQDTETSMEEGDAGASVKKIWSLEPGNDTGSLWAGTIPGGLFRSSDGGTSWRLNHPLWERPERKQWFGGGFANPGIHSICVDPGDDLRVTVGVSCGGVWVTDDGGESWECRSKGMWSNYMPPQRREDCFVQDPHRVVQCTGSSDVLWSQHHNGVFRTSDGAKSWQEVPNVQPSGFGFAAAVHPLDPGVAWFVPGVKDDCRIPVNAQVVVARTRNGGESFEVLRNGLPQEHAYDIVFRHGLDVDLSGERLAMGSTTGSLWISENGGDAWELICSHLPPIYCVRFAP